MQSRINYLDSSRGLAALVVLLAHFQLTILPAWSNEWILKTPLGIIFDGEAAVLYFFILSGYVLTLSLKETDGFSIRDYLRFILRRILRIYPAFIFTLLISFISVRFFSDHPASWLNRYWTTLPDFSSMLKQALLIKRFPNEPELRLLPHDWTLSIEIAVSFLVPMLAILSRKNPVLVLILIYCSAKFLSLDPFVFDFAIGVFIARFGNRFREFYTSRNTKLIMLMIALFFLCTYYLPEPVTRFMDAILIHHKSWGLAILFTLLLTSPVIKKILSFRPLNFLGRISYSFYLLHLVILLAMSSIFPGINPAVFLVLYLSLTIIFATITYIQIEKPFIRKY